MQGFPRSVPTILFRKVESILRADPLLGSFIQEWKTYVDGDASATPPAEGVPEICLFPYVGLNEGGQLRYTPSSDRTALNIGVRMSFNAKDAGDYLDVWFAVERAIFPADKDARNAILLELQALHSLSEPVFQLPVPDQDAFASEGRFDVTGAIVLAHVEINRNPD